MSDLFESALKTFTAMGLPDPEAEARQLTATLGKNGSATVDLSTVARKRLSGEPMAYILGRTRFMGLDFRCTPDALIPRAETELLVNTVIQRAKEFLQTQETLTIVDMGTGSGNIAVSLAVHLPQARVLACDVSETAVALAQFHTEKHGVADRVQVFCGDLFAPLTGLGIEEKVDIVVCNPPYIPTGSLPNLAAEIIEHEPIVALDAGVYGINIFRRLIRGAQDFLKPGGLLAFEIGEGQHQMAARLVQKNKGYETAVPVKLESIIRVITAIKKETSPDLEG